MMTHVDFLSFYQFCPQCGARISKRGDNLLVCRSFHRVYINPKPTNAAILQNRDGEILLVRRKHEPYKDMWDLPGGFVDLEEDIESSLKREIREELGIEPNDFQYVMSTNDFYEYGGMIHPTICLTYTANLDGEEGIKMGDDVVGYKFFTVKNIPFDEVGFPSMQRLLRQYFQESH